MGRIRVDAGAASAVLLLAVAFVVMVPIGAAAQSIAGVVRDSSGAVLPGVSIEATPARCTVRRSGQFARRRWPLDQGADASSAVCRGASLGSSRRVFEITSPRATESNCIAWAADDPANWWWPGKYWPAGLTPDDSVASFTAAFAALGYVACHSPKIEIGITKIVLYANELGSVTHAARQLENGMWSSKLGPQWDISHDLVALCGPHPAYGSIAQILGRPSPP